MILPRNSGQKVSDIYNNRCVFTIGYAVILISAISAKLTSRKRMRYILISSNFRQDQVYSEATYDLSFLSWQDIRVSSQP